MDGNMAWIYGDVSRERYGRIAMPGAAALPGAFAIPIRTRDCRFLPRTMETVPEALAAIQGLPAHVLRWRSWQSALKALTYAAAAKANRSELANMAAAEVRAALLGKGWLG
jgi:hypothetical protein